MNRRFQPDHQIETAAPEMFAVKESQFHEPKFVGVNLRAHQFDRPPDVGYQPDQPVIHSAAERLHGRRRFQWHQRRVGLGSFAAAVGLTRLTGSFHADLIRIPMMIWL